MNKQNFALGKINFILLAVSAAVVIIGFILMAGSGSTEEAADDTETPAKK